MKADMFVARLRIVSGFGVAVIITWAAVAGFGLAASTALPTLVTARREPPNATTKNEPAQSKLAREYGTLPLSFELNEGQTDGSVQFVSRGTGHTLFLTKNEAVIELQQHDTTALALQKMKPTKRKLFESRKFYRGSPRSRKSTKMQTIRVAMAGANPDPDITPLDEMPGKNSYFIGNDPKKWRTGVSTF